MNETRVQKSSERKFQVFFSGDYEFLYRVYGISGASGECTFPAD